eukprot:UN06522
MEVEANDSCFSKLQLKLLANPSFKIIPLVGTLIFLIHILLQSDKIPENNSNIIMNNNIQITENMKYRQIITKVIQDEYNQITFIKPNEMDFALNWICHVKNLDNYESILDKTLFIMFGNHNLMDIPNDQIIHLHDVRRADTVKVEILDELLSTKTPFTMFTTRSIWNENIFLIVNKFRQRPEQILWYNDDKWKFTVFQNLEADTDLTWKEIINNKVDVYTLDSLVTFWSHDDPDGFSLGANDWLVVTEKNKVTKQRETYCKELDPETQAANLDRKLEETIKNIKAQSFFQEEGVLKEERPPVLTICVLTMNRLSALNRLMGSVLKANYNGEVVDLRFSVDVEKTTNKRDNQIIDFVNKFEWHYGRKFVTAHDENQGIIKQWLNACGAIETEYDYTLILEDDLEVMSEYFQWLIHIKNDYFPNFPNIAGASLNRITWRPMKQREDFKVSNGNNPLASLLVGSWGHMPNPKFWLSFRSWVFEKLEEKDFYPRVPGLVMDDWYGSFIRQKRHLDMWTMWHI